MDASFILSFETHPVPTTSDIPIITEVSHGNNYADHLKKLPSMSAGVIADLDVLISKLEHRIDDLVTCPYVAAASVPHPIQRPNLVEEPFLVSVVENTMIAQDYLGARLRDLASNFTNCDMASKVSDSFTAVVAGSCNMLLESIRHLARSLFDVGILSEVAYTNIDLAVADAVSEEIGQNYTHYLNAQTIANNNAVIITNYLFNLL